MSQMINTFWNNLTFILTVVSIISQMVNNFWNHCNILSRGFEILLYFTTPNLILIGARVFSKNSL